jgi:hypothetical protein
MNTLKKTAYLGMVISTLALSGCLGGGGGSSSDVEDPIPLEQKTQAQRIADGDFKIAQADITANFAPIAGAQQFSGVLDGAIYRIEVPDSWNGTLIMWAHGFRGDEPTRLRVDNHPLREYLLSQGYAWAASSYSANFYDVRAGLVDTNKLALSFSDFTNLQPPLRYLISGFSMGGHVAGAAVERENKLALSQVDLDVNYEGSLPMCGVMGDTALFDYFGAYGLALLQFGGQAVSQYPITPAEAEEKLAGARDALWVDYDNNKGGDGLRQTAEAGGFYQTLLNLSGGERPIYPFSFGGFQPLLQSFVGSDGTVDGILDENIVDTTYIRYRFQSQQPGPNMPGAPDETGLTGTEVNFNSIIAQSIPVNNANPARDDGPRSIPSINGDFDVPVLTLHGLGDLFVPFHMEQIYRKRAIAFGNDDLLVQRAIRDTNHCTFTGPELVEAFDDWISWVDGGPAPSGDEILDPNVVADEDYGCKFTRANRLEGLGLPPQLVASNDCPTPP